MPHRPIEIAVARHVVLQDSHDGPRQVQSEIGTLQSLDCQLDFREGNEQVSECLTLGPLLGGMLVWIQMLPLAGLGGLFMTGEDGGLAL